MSEKIFNLFLFIKDSIIYELGASVHELEGTDQYKLEFLQSQALSDFSTAMRFPLPQHILRKFKIGQDLIIANLRYDEYEFLVEFDLYLQIFEEIFEFYSSPSSPLFCITPIVENEPRIDGIKTEEIKCLQDDQSVGVVVKSVQFEFPDYLVQYTNQGMFDFNKLLNDDYLKSIRLLYNNGHYISSLKLLLSFIDTLAYIELGDVSKNFHQWLNQYADMNLLGVSPDELWEVRNSLLHMTNADSRKVIKGHVDRVMFYVGDLPPSFPSKFSEAKYCSFSDLLTCILEAIEKWVNSYNRFPSKLKVFVERYDSIISDSRYQKIWIS